jgi:hypothetical protein
MHSQALYALKHPVYDPDTQITRGHFFWAAPRTSAGLTVNIGLE